MPNLAPHQ